MGNPSTEQTRRRKLRKKLRDRGMLEADIEAEVERREHFTPAERAKAKFDHDQKRRQARVAQAQAILDAELAERGVVDAAEAARERQRIEDETWARLNPSDKGFRPTRRDPLLVGAGRATGVAAKAATRGKTFTKWQIDEQEKR